MYNKKLMLAWAELTALALGALIALSVKCCPADPAVLSSIPTGGRFLFKCKSSAIAVFCYRLLIALVWLKYCWKGFGIASYPSIH